MGIDPLVLSGGGTFGALIRLWGPYGTPGLSMGAVPPRLSAYPPKGPVYEKHNKETLQRATYPVAQTGIFVHRH